MAPTPAKAFAPTDLHEQSMRTSALELRYERSLHLVEVITKQEDIRNLRFDVHILQDDNDELRSLLAQEEERSDMFEKLVNENLGRAELAESRMQELDGLSRQREQEILTLQAEAKALQTNAADSEAFLTEKLALTRELSILRPELAHAKAQATATEVLMTEKLELQRQQTELQCELENAKRDVKRAMAKRRNTGVEIAQEEQVEDLKRQLAKEKRARQRAEEAAESTQSDVSVDEVRKELAREKRARQKAEEALEAAQENTQVEDVRRDLLKEKKIKQKLEDTIESLQAELEKERKAAAKASKRAENVAETDEQVEGLRQELAKEKRERAKAEKAVQSTVDEYEAHKVALNEKLGQFRTKLKATKEKLKETEAELSAAREISANIRSTAAANPKKRNAAAFDPDATNFGTPGDGPGMKRNRKAPVGVGDKSTFSITPFLNRTMNVTENASDAEDNDDEAHPSVESPTTNLKLPLAPISASEANMMKKPSVTAARQRKGPKKSIPALAAVTEDDAEEGVHEQDQENIENAQPQKIKTKLVDGPGEDKPAPDGAAKKKSKHRKSLVDFATFNAEPAPEKKKKRKLGGLGKTLFDEDDNNDGIAAAIAAPTAKTIMPAGRMFLGGGRAIGGKKAGGGLLGAGRLGGPILAGNDGVQFSPLKKSRRNLDDTLRG
jgi:hypothetical protein